ncbi:hypothetical protein M8J77_001932 [Diaphorina citri]|nr:hypothetical protein M8J77_001932 [Diaphorina citri]
MKDKEPKLEVKKQGSAPTVYQINKDRITEVAGKYWAPHSEGSHLPYDANIVTQIYRTEIIGCNFAIRRIMMLEFSQYLENYLWPNYKTGEASHEHLMSIVIMTNEKFRERVNAWETFRKHPEHFPGLFHHVLKTTLKSSGVLMSEQTALVVFLNHCFNSMEEQLIRDQIKHLVSLSMWISLQQSRREQELRNVPKWRKYWKLIMKKDNPEEKEKLEWERKYLHKIMLKFLNVVENIPEEGDIPSNIVRYCERFIEFLIDLEALLSTRRFFNTIMDDCHLVVRCQLSPLTRRPEGHLFTQKPKGSQNEAVNLG